jgi:murein L,D-transpeptidase YcbB/YkuD
MFRQVSTLSLIACSLFAVSGVSQASGGDDVVTRLNATLYGPGLTQDADPDLKAFYRHTNHLPVWWRNGTWSPDVDVALAWLRDAQDIGMSDQRYAVETLEALFDRDLARGLTGGDITGLETALTRALLTFADERVTGRVDPTQTGWSVVATQDSDMVSALAGAVARNELATWLGSLAPVRNGYRELVSALAHYRMLDTFAWDTIPSGESLKPGAVDTRVPDISSRLILLGDLAPSVMREDDNIYDQAMADAVARFQGRHGLATDGVAGPKTLAELNVTPGERTQTIVANLERMRWLPDDETVGERRAEVNIPGYELVAYENN